MNEVNDTNASEYAILYVDDEEMALKYFQRFLGREFTVYTAADVDAGLDILAAHGDTIGVLITDQRMPGQSGVDLLKKVRQRWPNIVRLLTTAYADLDEAIEAVNRGEIFRYLTKPWDMKALRAEVSQAMNVFRLQHEHAQLMREKMSVWQRLIQLGRLRDLVVMSGSFSHLRHSENAVAAYLTDHLVPAEKDLASSEYLDLWTLTEVEIGRTLDFAQEILARTAGMTDTGERFETRLSADRLFALGGGAFASAHAASDELVPDILVAAEPADLLFEELARIGGDLTGHAQFRTDPRGDGLVLTLPTAAPAPDGLTAREAAGLLTAYLIAFHHGGSLKFEPADGHSAYVLRLPAEPDKVALTSPGTNYLAPLLVRLEGWD